MSVLFVHDHKFFKFQNNYYSNGALTGTVLQRYVDLFGDVTVLARCIELDAEPNNYSLSSIPGVKFITVPDYLSPRTFLRRGKVHRTIAAEVKRAEYVIARTSSLGVVAARNARRYNKPLFVEVVGCGWDAFWNHSLKGKLMAPLFFLQSKRMVRKAPFALYVTSKFLQQRYPTDGQSIGCSSALLTALAPEILTNRLARIDAQTEGQPMVLGTVAAIDVLYKDQASVIRAVAALSKKGRRFIYRMVGGGSSERLANLAKKLGVTDQVEFLGQLPHEKIPSFLDEVDVYIQPSQVEGLPRALVEALSRATPSAGTRIGGIPELLDESMVYTSGKIGELVTILESLDKPKLKAEAARNFEFAQSFAKEKLDNRRNEFYRAFIASYKS